MTKLEEIARVICQAACYDPDGRMSDVLALPNWRRYLGPARTLIAVLREPSEAQLLAMYNAMLAVSGIPSAETELRGRTARLTLTAEWQAAVDAILGEADKS
jgi:hypothetical protein